jgi:hypothetical protein
LPIVFSLGAIEEKFNSAAGDGRWFARLGNLGQSKKKKKNWT